LGLGGQKGISKKRGRGVSGVIKARDQLGRKKKLSAVELGQDETTKGDETPS